MLACILSVMLKTKHVNKLITYVCKRLYESANIRGVKNHPISEYPKFLHERDTSDVWRQFVICLLLDEENGVIRFTKPRSIQHNAINRVAGLYLDDCQDIEIWKEAAKDAWTAWHAADKTYTKMLELAEDAWDDVDTEAGYNISAETVAETADDVALIAGCVSAAAETATYAAAAWDSYVADSLDFTFIGVFEITCTQAAFEAVKTAAGGVPDYYKFMADKLVELIKSAPLKETP